MRGAEPTLNSPSPAFDAGTMNISSPALTALDLLRYPQASGGIHHVATVLSDLAEKIDPEQLAAISALVERRSCSVSGICWSMSAATP